MRPNVKTKLTHQRRKQNILKIKRMLIQVMRFWAGLGQKLGDIKSTIELDIISIILGDSTSSRMYQNLIEKRTDALFNMVSAEHYQFKDGDNFFIQANFRADAKDLALDLIKEELRKLTEIRITDAELAKAKKKIKTRFCLFGRNSFRNRRNNRLLHDGLRRFETC